MRLEKASWKHHSQLHFVVVSNDRAGLMLQRIVISLQECDDSVLAPSIIFCSLAAGAIAVQDRLRSCLPDPLRHSMLLDASIRCPPTRTPRLYYIDLQFHLATRPLPRQNEKVQWGDISLRTNAILHQNLCISRSCYSIISAYAVSF